MRIIISFYLTILLFLCCFSTVIVASSLPNIPATSSSITSPKNQNINDEHIVWQREPIKIVLPVGKERLITFPTIISFGYDNNLLPPKILRVQNNNQTLYLLAKKPFAEQRVEAKLENGEIILIDLSAKKEADSDPVDIVLPKGRKLDLIQPSSSATINYTSLTRFAIQQLYAPKRLLKQPFNITRFPMETSHVIPLFYDGSALTMPLASWRANDLYITAILIKNLLSQNLRIDPRLLCGNWKTASLYPQDVLLPHGSSFNRDTTTLFLISDRPFAEAVQGC